jgi:DNA-binding response OmpR family regulator
MEALGPSTVLVVEDEPAVRNLITAALKDEGYRVLQARNGQEAIRVVNEQPAGAERPCLVLLDLMLPDLNGLQVLERLAAPDARVPVVAMSASRQHLAAAQESGADAVLPKPFELDRLVGVVDACCAQSS